MQFEVCVICDAATDNQGKLQTIEAVLYTNHLGYLPEPWRSRLRDNPDGLTREREELCRSVGYS